MVVKFEKGQRVKIRPAGDKHLSPRDSTLEPYAGQSGRVTDYYWVTLRGGQAVYLYNVLMETDRKELVLHEDELEAYVG